MNNKIKTKKKYSSFAEYYDLGTFLFEILFFKRLRKKLLKEARGKVLEIGAGTGKNLSYYSEDTNLTLTDYSPEMLEIAKKRSGKMGIKAKFKIADAERLPVGNKQFDTIVDTLGLCTYPNPIKALNEMSRVCKQNGRILLFEHGISNTGLIRKIQNLRERKHYKQLGCHLTRNYLEIIPQTKLRVESVKRSFFGIFYLIVLRKNQPKNLNTT